MVGRLRACVCVTVWRSGTVYNGLLALSEESLDGVVGRYVYRVAVAIVFFSLLGGVLSGLLSSCLRTSSVRSHYPDYTQSNKDGNKSKNAEKDE